MPLVVAEGGQHFAGLGPTRRERFPAQLDLRNLIGGTGGAKAIYVEGERKGVFLGGGDDGARRGKVGRNKTQAVAAKRLADLTLIGRAVGEIAIVVIGREYLHK